MLSRREALRRGALLLGGVAVAPVFARLPLSVVLPTTASPAPDGTRLYGGFIHLTDFDPAERELWWDTESVLASWLVGSMYALIVPGQWYRLHSLKFWTESDPVPGQTRAWGTVQFGEAEQPRKWETLVDCAPLYWARGNEAEEVSLRNYARDTLGAGLVDSFFRETAEDAILRVRSVERAVGYPVELGVVGGDDEEVFHVRVDTHILSRREVALDWGMWDEIGRLVPVPRGSTTTLG